MAINAASSKTDITRLQNALNQYASAGLIPDGAFGPKTLAAVQNFQGRFNFPKTTTYFVDDVTLSLLGLPIGLGGAGLPYSGPYAPGAQTAANTAAQASNALNVLKNAASGGNPSGNNSQYISTSPPPSSGMKTETLLLIGGAVILIVAFAGKR